MTVLYYLRLVQPIVNGLAWLMQRTLRVSGAESLSAASNIFLGQTEAPLVIRPYLSSMTSSEIYAVMVGGFANVAGSVMAAFVEMGIDGGHILTASVMSAPASLLIAKIMEPEIGRPVTTGTVSVSTPQTATNVLEAAADGASEGMKLAINVAAMLIAFLAFLALADYLIGNLGLLLGFSNSQGQPIWSLAGGLSYLFAPLAWVMGIESKDCLHAGELLGIKTAANEFIAYAQLGQWIEPGSGVEMSERSVRILTYALCGFSNFSSIGIQIGGIGGMVPERRAEIARFGLRAMIGGSLATFMTACVAGVLL
jgi:CNT family concentrative nucleoside transporter